MDDEKTIGREGVVGDGVRQQATWKAKFWEDFINGVVCNVGKRKRKRKRERKLDYAEEEKAKGEKREAHMKFRVSCHGQIGSRRDDARITETPIL